MCDEKIAPRPAGNADALRQGRSAADMHGRNEVMVGSAASTRGKAAALWTGVIVLTAITLVFVVIRASVLARADRSARIDVFDVRYLEHPATAVVHIAAGTMFLVFAPFQFVARLRNRHLAVHRWSGRLLVASGVVFALSGIAFGLSWPFGGSLERTATVAFGAVFLFALVEAVRHIRGRRVQLHREWMIRMFAIALGVSMIRVVTGLLVGITGGMSPAVFGVSFWVGWMVSLAFAEFWIRSTRRRA